MAALLTATPAAVPGQELLRLHEVFARALPDSFELTGAVAAPTGEILAWASNQPYLLLFQGDSLRLLGGDALHRPVAAAFYSDSTIEVVDDTELVLLAMDGALRGRRPLAAPLHLVAAARGRSTWFVGGYDSDRDEFRLYVVRQNRAQLRRVLGGDPRDDTTSTPTRREHHLTAVGDTVLATSIGPPFASVAIDTGGRMVGTLLPDTRDLGRWSDSGASGLERDWVSLRALAIDSLYVQTLSDLRSDRRLLLLFSTTGKEIRRIVLEVPLGLMAVDPARRLLLAARRLNRLEIVAYRWQWREAR